MNATGTTGADSPVNHILRNPRRVLRHLPLRAQKLKAMQRLGFLPDADPAPDRRALLAAAMDGSLTNEGVVPALCAQSGLPAEEVRAQLRTLYRTGLLEFHITDRCDLSCENCHYRAEPQATYPYGRIEETIAALAPRAITITGGEPNVYRDGARTMNDVVRLISERFPDIQLGLINNNTQLPEGDWPARLCWQRSSLDAAERETYRRIKRADKFEQTVQNVCRLLDSPLPYVGVGFLYRDENIEELPDFLSDWYGRWRQMDALARAKLNLQFRPISPAIEQTPAYDRHNPMEARMSAALRRVRSAAGADPAFDAFLRGCTNFYSIRNAGGSYFLHEPQTFSRCQNALLHRVVRSDGTEYPDFLLCSDPSLALGNALTARDPDRARERIALNTLYFYFCNSPYCDGRHCRQGWVSRIVEQNAHADPNAPELSDSYFF